MTMIDLLARAVCAIACVGAAHAAIITVTPLTNLDTALVTVEGELVFEDIQAFRQRVNSQPKALVALQSDGGSVLAGIEIGKIIRLRNFATLVPDNVRCASACALAWLGGAVRFMGPQAQIGFHAAYVLQSGQASETGIGNALVGAYLANIGLPDSAVMYVTQASPRAMTWLNIAEAQQRGIDVALFTPTQNDPSPQANSQPIRNPPPDIELSRRATDFVVSLLVRWSDPNSAYALQLLNSVYAAQVSYYGATRTKQEVLQDKSKFSERWPQRHYRVRDGSLNTHCDAAISACNVSGIVDWEVGSTNRNTKSSGSASFIYGLTFVGQSALIVQEGGSVLDRTETGALPSH
jgi:hypothetical protein